MFIFGWYSDTDRISQGRFLMFFLLAFLLLAAVFGSASYYIAHRLDRCVRHFLPGFPRWIRWVFTVLSAVLLALVFARSALSGGLVQSFSTVGAYWMGIFIYLLLFLLLADLVLFVLRLVAGKASGLVRSIAVLAAVGLALGVSCYGFVHGMELEEVSYDITVEKPMDRPVELVLISDLHLGAAGSEDRLVTVVERINALQPELVCIAGDLFDSNFSAIRDPDRVRALFLSLDAPVYACLGNHDAGETAKQMVDFLESCNVILLEDAYTVVDGRLLLVGRLDGGPIGGFSQQQKRADLATVLAGADTSLPVVVMDHNPAHIHEYDAPVDLILSGHTHKGQLFPANLLTDLMYAEDYGYYRQDPGSPQLVVTSGAGAWGMPMRVGTDCEIVSITLHS